MDMNCTKPENVLNVSSHKETPSRQWMIQNDSTFEQLEEVNNSKKDFKPSFWKVMAIGYLIAFAGISGVKADSASDIKKLLTASANIASLAKSYENEWERDHSPVYNKPWKKMLKSCDAVFNYQYLYYPFEKLDSKIMDKFGMIRGSEVKRELAQLICFHFRDNLRPSEDDSLDWRPSFDMVPKNDYEVIFPANHFTAAIRYLSSLSEEEVSKWGTHPSKIHEHQKEMSENCPIILHQTKETSFNQIAKAIGVGMLPSEEEIIKLARLVCTIFNQYPQDNDEQSSQDNDEQSSQERYLKKINDLEEKLADINKKLTTAEEANKRRDHKHQELENKYLEKITSLKNKIDIINKKLANTESIKKKYKNENEDTDMAAKEYNNDAHQYRMRTENETRAFPTHLLIGVVIGFALALGGPALYRRMMNYME